MATIIDTLVTRFEFRTDRRGLQQSERQLESFKRRASTVVGGISRGVKVGGALIAGLGTASFFTGSKTEREFIKLQTQLGLTREETAAIRPELRALSRDTARPLAELAAGYFNLRSAGLSHAKALDAITASAKASNGQLGETNTIARLVGASMNAYSGEIDSATRFTDLLIATVREGNLEARELTSGFGQLLQVAPHLGIGFADLGAIVAGATRTFPEANRVITQLQQILFGILRPTEMAKKVMKDLGIEAEDLRRRASEDLIGALQWLRLETGDNEEGFARLFESQEAVALLMDITGQKADDYRTILRNLKETVGDTDQAQQTWASSGFAEAEKASNDAQLRLEDLYNKALVPLLAKFGEMPGPLQEATVAMLVLSGASMLLGGPSALGLLAGAFGIVTSAVGVAVAAITGLIALVGSSAATGIPAFARQLLALDTQRSPGARPGLRAGQRMGFSVAEGADDLLSDPIQRGGRRSIPRGGVTRGTPRRFGRGVPRIRRLGFAVGLVDDLEPLAEIGRGGTTLSSRLAQASRGVPILGRVVRVAQRVAPVARAAGRVLGVAGHAETVAGMVGIGVGISRAATGARGTQLTAQPVQSGFAGALGPAGFDVLREFGSAYTGTTAGSTIQDNRTFNINEGAITIHAAPGQSEREIANESVDALHDQIGAVPLAFDSSILR